MSATVSAAVSATVQPSATLFDLQRFCVHDGPGIRTVVFFKGCGLQCRWCQNPESMRGAEELVYRQQRCLGCNQCSELCPALGVEKAGRVDWSKCDDCGRCAVTCPSGALEMVGRSITVNELVQECLEDKPFMSASGGGITLSGGEPVLQNAFLLAFLPLIREQGVNVLLETAGHYSSSLLQRLLPFIDHIYFDWKSSGDAAHLLDTGQTRLKIEANLRMLVDRQFPFTLRLPVIPGVNTDSDTVAVIGARLREIGVKSVALLNYNNLWESKLSWLRTKRQPLGLKPLSSLSELQAEYQKQGLTASA